MNGDTNAHLEDGDVPHAFGINGETNVSASALFGSRSSETRTRKTGDIVRLNKLTAWIRLGRLDRGKIVKRHRAKDSVVVH